MQNRTGRAPELGAAREPAQQRQTHELIVTPCSHTQTPVG